MDQLIQPIVFNTEVETLLKSYDLPTSDLPVSSGVLLFGHASGGALIGVIGLEVYGEYALLRSLAVADPIISCNPSPSGGSLPWGLGGLELASSGLSCLCNKSVSKLFETSGPLNGRRL